MIQLAAKRRGQSQTLDFDPFHSKYLAEICTPSLFLGLIHKLSIKDVLPRQLKKPTLCYLLQCR